MLQGVTEITLLGQNVNSYGRDLTRRRPLFASLLRAVGAVDGIERVRFTSPHPKDIRPETIEAMAETPAVCEHLHLPLQSGSDSVLKMMRRGYTAERYLQRLADARSAIDELAVTTDLIVGFPGETDEDAERTLEVVAEARFDSAYTFVFSPRPGTRAAAMTDSFVAAGGCRRTIRTVEGRVGTIRSHPSRGKSRSRRARTRRGGLQTRPGRSVRTNASRKAGALPDPGRQKACARQLCTRPGDRRRTSLPPR